MAEVESLNRRLEHLQRHYDEQVELAGDNERAKKEIRLKGDREADKMRQQIAEKEWKARRSAIIIDTATGIMRAFATLPTPAAIIESAVIAALGASQLAIVNRTKPQGFAKGVLNLKGPGSETSDSIPAMLSRGESVMTAQETRKSMGLLQAIKANRIDDRILKSIDFSGGRNVVLNDEKIVEAIKNQVFPKPPDLIKQGRQIIETYTDKNGNRKKIRSKSMG
jgi:hypothetical protein